MGKLSNSEVRLNHEYLTGWKSLVDDSFLWIYFLAKRFYWRFNIFTGPTCLCHLSWNRSVEHTWPLLSEAFVTGWTGTKKSFSKIHPTKRQGSQPYQPRALASRRCDGKTNSPTGKRKTLMWMWRKKGPWAGNMCLDPNLWSLAFWHLLPRISVGYIYIYFFN